MRLKDLYIFLFFIFIFPAALQAQSVIYGLISDTTGISVDLANIAILNSRTGTMSQADGSYELEVPSDTPLEITISCIGFLPQTTEIMLKKGQRKKIDFVLVQDVRSLDPVSVSARQDQGTTFQRFDVRNLDYMMSTSSKVEDIIKSQAGVSANNELTSQYSVRGGNFDENLVYVNDIEIYRPFLVRSGQQEGLSFINSDLVSGIRFSAGGFDARYGDKMSSALDITYKTPTKFEGSVSASLLGASLHFEGISKNKKLSYLAGYRYKTTSYLLNTLETSGDYNPQFSDFQTLVSYRFSRKVELSFLGNYSSNMYNFVPEKRTTEFGTDKLPYEFNIWYSGQEIDKFETYLGALSLNITPVNNLNLKFIATTFRTKEQETFDIKGEYSINELDNSEGSETYGDSILNIGVGTLLSHARNYLDAYVTAGSHIGTWKTDQHLVKWGMKFQYQYFLDRINEWEVVDSAGYTVPNSDTIILVSNYSRANNLIDYNLFTSFIQDTWELNLHKANIYFNYGVRASLWNFNRALMISPRMTMSIKPAWERDVMLHVSAGVYYQPPFYKEMRTMDNTINYSILPQRSIHVLVGGDYLFTAWERPFKLTAEAYYKWLDDLIPYKIDNLRISYSGENIASGYATGLDLKINGEFVPGAESWFTASIMQTMEDIAGDSISIREDDVLYRVPAGYYPRPTNQTFTAGFYFQDYLPWNPDYKVSVSAFFGTGLPLSQPIDDIYYTKFKMGAYRRVDIGFFKVIKKEGQILGENNPFRHFGSIWVSAEIFNLLGLDNQASVSWIRTVSNQSGLQGMFGVPNYLTGRRLNIKLAAKF